MNNGMWFSSIGNFASTAVYRDGNLLYAGPLYGRRGPNQTAPVETSPETDGETWSDFNAQQFAQGPFEFAEDSPRAFSTLRHGTRVFGVVTRN